MGKRKYIVRLSSQASKNGWRKRLARHLRCISFWDIHVQKSIPLGRINRVPQYALRTASTPHKSCSVKASLTGLTAFREKILASLACYHFTWFWLVPCRLLRTKNHHSTVVAPFPWFSASATRRNKLYGLTWGSKVMDIKIVSCTFCRAGS